MEKNRRIGLMLGNTRETHKSSHIDSNLHYAPAGLL